MLVGRLVSWLVSYLLWWLAGTFSLSFWNVSQLCGGGPNTDVYYVSEWARVTGVTWEIPIGGKDNTIYIEIQLNGFSQCVMNGISL